MADRLAEKCAAAQGAAKGDVWRAHVLEISSDSKIWMLEKDLAQAKRDLKTKEETAEAATHLFALWDDLRDLLKIAQNQHEEYVRVRGTCCQCSWECSQF
jgi:hypothetical protein